MEHDDPGWPISWRTLLWLVVPGLGLQRQVRQRGEVDGLVLLRQVFLSFWFALAGFGVVLALLHAGSEPLTNPSTGVAVGLLVMGAVGIATETRLEQPLDCSDDTLLATSYRTRFFLRVAFAEAAALFGFVGYFLTHAWWPYPLGVAVAVIGFIRAAPTARNLARDQEALLFRQCGRSLIGALRTTSPPPSEVRAR